MRAPCAQPRVARYDPVSLLHAAGSGAGGEDFEAGFIAGDGGGLCGAEGRGERWDGGIGALDLVDVGGVEGGGQSAEGEEVGVRWGEGVSVEAAYKIALSAC